MSNDVPETVQDTVEDILKYLRDHPQARDTLDGILDWWLLRERYRQKRALVQDALEYMVEQSLVARRTNPDGVTIYEAAPPPCAGRPEAGEDV